MGVAGGGRRRRLGSTPRRRCPTRRRWRPRCRRAARRRSRQRRSSHCRSSRRRSSRRRSSGRSRRRLDPEVGPFSELPSAPLLASMDIDVASLPCIAPPARRTRGTAAGDEGVSDEKGDGEERGERSVFFAHGFLARLPPPAPRIARTYLASRHFRSGCVPCTTWGSEPSTARSHHFYPRSHDDDPRRARCAARRTVRTKWPNAAAPPHRSPPKHGAKFASGLVMTRPRATTYPTFGTRIAAGPITARRGETLQTPDRPLQK